ncbi:MFS transporter [Novosphingobium flavum]|uniref:MFS transporter n=2 Tax=Novosphingobium flavum TaxID=1778672 RepID=A0A7X1FTS6_9SPHN|nr:MFS transporter [Novosphingobium flavum]
MENIDATVLTTALPTMARDFGVRAPEMSVAVTSYLLSLAVFIPASGYLCDRHGTRRVFSAAILLFVAGSVACALSPSLLTLAAARVLQGIGGAMMVPVGRLIILRSVERHELVPAQSWLLVPGLLGTILGPPVGGFVVTYLKWHWIFWINVPIGLVGIVLVRRFIGDFREPSDHGFDFAGFVLSGLALGALLFGFELVGTGSNPRLGWGLVGGGVLCALGYVAHYRRRERAILDLSLLRVPTFRLSVIGGSLIRITHGAQSFLMALMLQIGFGYSAAASGLITLAPAVGSMPMKSLVPPILRRLGFRRAFILFGMGGTILYAVCGFFRPGWPAPAMFAVLCGAGFLLSFQFTAYNTIAYDEIPPARMSSAASFYSTLQQLTLSLGVCTAATVTHLSMSAGGRARPALADFSTAFWAVTAISFLSLFANLRFDPQAGSELSGAKTGAA